MKKVNKFLSVILVLIMVMSMTACNANSSKNNDSDRERTRREERSDREESKEKESKESEEDKESKESNDSENDKKDEEKSSKQETETKTSGDQMNYSDGELSGSYVAYVPIKNFADADSVAEMEEMGMTNLLDTSMQFILAFNSQSDFTIAVDMDALKKDMSERLLVDADNLMKKMFQESGVTPDQYDTVAQIAGYADYEAMKKDMVKEFESAFEESVGSEMDEFHMDGKYKVSGNEIIFESDEKAKIQPDGSIKMSLESDGISLNLVFEKASSSL